MPPKSSIASQPLQLSPCSFNLRLHIPGRQSTYPARYPSRAQHAVPYHPLQCMLLPCRPAAPLIAIDVCSCPSTASACIHQPTLIHPPVPPCLMPPRAPTPGHPVRTVLHRYRGNQLQIRACRADRRDGPSQSSPLPKPPGPRQHGVRSTGCCTGCHRGGTPQLTASVRKQHVEPNRHGQSRPCCRRRSSCRCRSCCCSRATAGCEAAITTANSGPAVRTPAMTLLTSAGHWGTTRMQATTAAVLPPAPAAAASPAIAWGPWLPRTAGAHRPVR